VKKYDKFILVVLLLVFGFGIFFTARSAFSSYVTFAEAAESNRNVQVKGVALEGTLQELDADSYSFELEDMSGVTHRVMATGMIPVNIFEVEYIVVQGRFTDETFTAKQVIVKCPSKYQVEEKK
jgi:cytochrome c-type biogenesis protein CcmE